MMLNPLPLLLALLLQNGTFEQSLAERDFDAALSMAGESDSLAALVFRASGGSAAASRLFARAFEEEPSGGLFSMMWSAISEDTEHLPELSASLLRSELTEWGPRLEWSPDAIFSLLWTAASLEDSALSDSLTDVLLLLHPLSDEASEVIGWEFWDSLYPVWNDDSARALVLEDFIGEWGDRSDLWRSRAWRYLIGASLTTADSVLWEEQLEDWIASCPDDPQAYLSGAILHMERDSSYAEAILLADAGLSLMGSPWWPAGMSFEEWEITADALEADLFMRRSMALLLQGDPQGALEGVTGISRSDIFGVRDHHTRAPYLWLEGEAALALGDTSLAMDAWLEAVILGDERNRWTDSSLVSLAAILPTDLAVGSWGRSTREYDGPVFRDVTSLLGPDSMVSGSRVSWCDWNADGWPDLLLGRDLYRNDSGTGFTLVSDEVFSVVNSGSGGIWGDLDGDGSPDLVTAGYPVQVFIASGGKLEDRTGEIGITPTDARVEGVGLLDWNADGWLDLYLASYEVSGSTGEGTGDHFYLGGPDGFVEVSDSLGMEPFLGTDLCGRGVSPCDLDRDGDMDIFVSNYRLQENFMWENESGIAVNSALALGVAGHDTEGWWGHTIGSDWGDFDGDGQWDLFSANLAHPRYISFSDRSELLHSREGGFMDVSAAVGIRFEETHSNPVWGDFDNDGLLDLYITSIYEDRRSFLYRGMDGGWFTEVGFLSGARVCNGWGASTADFDRDGRLDLVVGSGSGPVLLRNETPEGNWLLVGVSPPEGVNTSGLGCTVEVIQGESILIRQVSGGSGTTSQNEPVLHFGLPSDEAVDIRLYVPGDPLPVWETSGVPVGSMVTAGP